MYRFNRLCAAAALIALASPSQAEPDRFVAGWGIYVGVEGGPMAFLMPDYKTLDFSTDGAVSSDGKFTADNPLFGFGGGLTIGLPIDGSLFGGGLRLELRGSIGQATASQTDTPVANPLVLFNSPMPDIPTPVFFATGAPFNISAQFDREVTTWWGEGRVYLDYNSGGTRLSPFVGVIGGALDQLGKVDYTFDGPTLDPVWSNQKDDMTARYIGGEIGLNAAWAIGERWSLGVNGGVALMRVSGHLNHSAQVLFFTGTPSLLSDESDSDSALAVKADLGIDASYRFAGGITLAFGISGTYLSAAPTLDTPNTLDPLTIATVRTGIDFEDAWLGQANLTLTIPF